MVLAATNVRNIGYVLAAIIFIGFVIYLFINWRMARPEVGSEIELASNRKPYLDDETLESRKLDASLGIGLVTLAVIAVALPMYWLAEPGRQDGAKEGAQETAVKRGEELFNQFCSGCHAKGAVGGVTQYVLTDSDGNYIDTVDWKVPALNTVLFRFSKEEVTFVVTYGRGSTPMPAWGLAGGGAMNEQQVSNVVDYLESIQLSEEDARAEVHQGLVDAYTKKAVDQALADDPRLADASLSDEASTALETEITTKTTDEATTEVEAHLEANEYDYDHDGVWSSSELGQAMFNLEANSGTYSCARCHTKGWSYGEPETSGGGFLGPNLTGGSETRQFPSFDEQVAFVTEGGQKGQAYGQGGVSGAGMMPGFGFNPNAEEEGSPLSPEQFMYTQAQIEAVVQYERGL
jgi:mono/diheme cytochrome c family protein